MSLGLRLRIWMKKSGYTQQELAEITGVSRVSINNYINGNYEPKRDFFDKLRELGADVDYLLNGRVALETTRELMRHKSIDTTIKHYTLITEQEKNEALNALTKI